MRNIAEVKPLLPRNIAEQIIHTLIFSRLDYCNSLFTCLNNTAAARLQLAQNTAAQHREPPPPPKSWLIYTGYQSIREFNSNFFRSTHPSFCSKTPQIGEPNPAIGSMVRTENKGGDCAFTVPSPILWSELPLKCQSSWVSSHSLKSF